MESPFSCLVQRSEAATDIEETSQRKMQRSKTEGLVKKEEKAPAEGAQGYSFLLTGPPLLAVRSCSSLNLNPLLPQPNHWRSSLPVF